MKAPNDYADLLASDPTRYTAPPAPNGVRDLLLGLLFALLVCALLLPSCVTRPVTKAVGREVPNRDSRTKRVEPYMSRK